MNGRGLNKALLVLNMVLAGAVIILALRRPTVQHLPPAVPNASKASSNKTPLVIAGHEPQSYTNLATTADWRQWIDQLRAAGVPNGVLARLVQSDFDDRWQKRQDEVQEEYNRGEVDVDALTALTLKHEVEQENELRTALGEEGFRSWNQERLFQGLNLKDLNLTAAETNALYALKKNLQQRLRDLDQSKLNGEIDQADLNDQQEKAQASFDQQLKALLGDERYATMQGIVDAAGDLRRNLRDVNPSSAQFAAMLDIQSNWNASRMALQLQADKAPDASIEQQIKAMDDARDREYQRVLGTNGFEKFQAEQDSRYTDMERYANNWGISDADIGYVYRTIQYYEKSVQDYRQQVQAFNQQGQAIGSDTVQKNLQQFSQQTEQSLRNYLGDDRFNKLKRNGIINFNAQ
ncbi:MAG: hypothetical protein ABSD57_06510 [Verrucomicrobiota bacterium]|jgi:uncharacterized protein YoxC